MHAPTGAPKGGKQGKNAKGLDNGVQSFLCFYWFSFLSISSFATVTTTA